MFYSVFVLGKKGPLARVWLAAHWDKKITKSQILETNIVESVDSILQPRIKLSLRTSSHLLLGIVRIYARKTVYLLQDCQDAAFKIKSAFRPGAVDLPEGKQEAALNAITMPEVLDFVTNFDLIEPPAIIDPVVNTTNHRNITLSEDIAFSSFDNTWGSQNVSKVAIARDRSTMSGAEALAIQFDNNVTDDGFGGLGGDDFFQVDIDANGAPKLPEVADEDRPASRMSDGIMSVGGDSPMGDDDYPMGGDHELPSTPGGAGDYADIQGPFDSMRAEPIDMPRGNENVPPINVPDSMVLEPLSIPQSGGEGQKRKRRKKLGIIIDDIKTLSGEEIKAQLSDTKDIVTILYLAPPSKQLMEVKRTNIDKLFLTPECRILSRIPLENYQRNLISSKFDQFDTCDTPEAEEMVRDPTLNLNGTSTGGMMLDSFAGDFDSTSAGAGPGGDVSFLLDDTPDLLPPRTPKTPAAYCVEQDDDDAPVDAIDETINMGESEEQYEERIRSRRTNILLKLMSRHFEEGPVQFSTLCRNNRRKQVAQNFFSLLVLKKQQAINLCQADTGDSYGEISITKGPRYSDFMSSNSTH